MAKLPSYMCWINRDKAVNLRWLLQIDHETDVLFLEGCKENFFIGEPSRRVEGGACDMSNFENINARRRL